MHFSFTLFYFHIQFNDTTNMLNNNNNTIHNILVLYEVNKWVYNNRVQVYSRARYNVLDSPITISAVVVICNARSPPHPPQPTTNPHRLNNNNPGITLTIISSCSYCTNQMISTRVQKGPPTYDVIHGGIDAFGNPYWHWSESSITVERNNC